jgi:hypothetical protein
MLRKLSITLWVLILLFFVVLGYFTFGHYSDGSRAGTLVKLSKKGFLFKTYEGELNTQMFIDNNAAASGVGFKVWSFSVVANDSLIQQMENAMLDGHRVKLQYKERFFKLPWIGDTEYIVYGMEKLDAKK